jgi:L-threonylcarbamoyladenylate synthase
MPEAQHGAASFPSVRTRIERVDPEAIDPAVIERAAEVIRSGGLVAFPTETVYGLGGDALKPDAARKIYAAKGRPSDNPLIVHVADLDHVRPIVREIPAAALSLADAFWPGPLTMIFRKTDAVPYETSGGLDTVAVRMPVDPVAAELIRASGGYIAAPSANTSGRPSPTTAQHVAEDLSGRIEMILDGGPADIGLESTIVDLTEEVPVILRPGFINREMLTEVLGEVRLDPGLLDENANRGIRPKAPGMRYRHYAPRSPLFVVEGRAERVTEKILAMAAEDCRRGKRVGIIASDESAGSYRDALGHVAAGAEGAFPPVILDIGRRDADITIARHLFSVLREFDARDTDVIYSESFETPKLGMAIMNRLLKAAGHQILDADR